MSSLSFRYSIYKVQSRSSQSLWTRSVYHVRLFLSRAFFSFFEVFRGFRSLPAPQRPFIGKLAYITTWRFICQALFTIFLIFFWWLYIADTCPPSHFFSRGQTHYNRLLECLYWTFIKLYVHIGFRQQKQYFFNQATVGEARSLPPGWETECLVEWWKVGRWYEFAQPG